MEGRLRLRINSILDHIEKILKDTSGLPLEGFKSSDLLVRATCFSLAQIGEQMAKLEEQLGEKYPDLPWKRAKGLRNFIVHDYEHIDEELVYVTVTEDLQLLKESFLEIKQDLEKER